MHTHAAMTLHDISIYTMTQNYFRIFVSFALSVLHSAHFIAALLECVWPIGRNLGTLSMEALFDVRVEGILLN